MKSKKTGAFTLIKLLIAIGIFATLAGAVFLAVGPDEQVRDIDDSERKSEIGLILNAIHKYQADSGARNVLPSCIVNFVVTAIPECNSTGLGDFDGALELGKAASSYDCSTTLIPSYLKEIPIDPASSYNSAKTGYWVCQDTTGAVPRVFVIAEGAEVSKTEGGCAVPGTVDPTMCVSG